MSVRDLVAWVDFINVTSAAVTWHNATSAVPKWAAFLHGAMLVFLDGVGIGGWEGGNVKQETCLAAVGIGMCGAYP